MAKTFHIPFTKVRIARFLSLLISMIFLFVVNPFLEGFVGINILMDIFLSVILLSGIYAVSERRAQVIVALLLALPTFLLHWSYYFLKIPSFLLTANIFGTIFLAYTAIVILMHLFRNKEITIDVILGSVCVYFLIGLMWGFVYLILESLCPGSFLIERATTNNLADFMYYSFVTLSTLGYGDIVPLSSPARSLSALEAIMGQLYIAVLIARLVGIHISQSSD
jgi:hypothetical protein